MNLRILLPIALTGVLLPAASASAQTLESLQKRTIQVQKSEVEQANYLDMRQNYRSLLDITSNTQKRYQIMRRLADINLSISTRKVSADDAAQHAADLYRKLLAAEDYNGNKSDLLYQLARATKMAGNTKASTAVLTKLAQKYPDYKLLDDAYFQRAELRFSQGKYESAAADYTRFINNTQKSEYILQAYYKRGWAYYNLARNEAALRDQLKVLKTILEPENFGDNGSIRHDTLSTGQNALLKDALRNMTLNFVVLDKDYTPHDFIEQVEASRYEYVLVNALYQHYLDKKRFTDASSLALQFARQHPNHPQAKTLEVQSIRALAKGGFTSQVLQAKKAYAIRYGIDKASWYGKPPLEVPKVRTRLKKYLETITKHLHAHAQQTGQAKDYLAAASWYSKYLKIFPQSERATEIAFLRGEALTEAGHYRDAAKSYELAAYELPQDKHSAEAAYAALLSWRQVAGNEIANSQAVKSATLRFASNYPKHPQATEALAVLAEGRYNAGQYELAMSVARALIEHRPKADKDQRLAAWHILAAASMESKKWTSAEKALGWLLKHPHKHQTKHYEQLATAIYRQAEALEKADKDKAAAKTYLRVLEDIPAGVAEHIRTVALYDAAAARIRTKAYDKAIRLLKRFRQKHPKHKLTDKATRRLASLYLKQRNKAKAARAFTQVRDLETLNWTVRTQAAAKAARLYADVGQEVAAKQAYLVLLNAFQPSFSTTVEAQHKLIQMNAKAGNAQLADQWRQRLIQAHDSAGDKRTDRSRTLAAHAALALASDKRRMYEQVDVAPPLEESIKAKTRRLEATLQAYSKAASYGITEVSTAVTYLTGDLYYDFSQALLKSPVPDKLKGKERTQYKILLQQQAFPFEKKAINLQQNNMARITKNGLYNEWIKKSLNQLAKLFPARYAKKEQTGNGVFHLQ